MHARRSSHPRTPLRLHTSHYALPQLPVLLLALWTSRHLLLQADDTDDNVKQIPGALWLL